MGLPQQMGQDGEMVVFAHRASALPFHSITTDSDFPIGNFNVFWRAEAMRE